MPSPRKHHHADEIRRLIEQLARWSGNAAGHSTSPLAWIGDFMRRRPDEYGPVIPLLSGEAADTLEALRRMAPNLRQAIEMYYAGPPREREQLKLLNRRKCSTARISGRTYRRHVEQAHDAFWEQYMAVRRMAQSVASRNRATESPLLSSPGIAAPRPKPGNSEWRKTAGERLAAEIEKSSDSSD